MTALLVYCLREVNEGIEASAEVWKPRLLAESGPAPRPWGWTPQPRAWNR